MLLYNTLFRNCMSPLSLSSDISPLLLQFSFNFVLRLSNNDSVICNTFPCPLSVLFSNFSSHQTEIPSPFPYHQRFSFGISYLLPPINKPTATRYRHINQLFHSLYFVLSPWLALKTDKQLCLPTDPNQSPHLFQNLINNNHNTVSLIIREKYTFRWKSDELG